MCKVQLQSMSKSIICIEKRLAFKNFSRHIKKELMCMPPKKASARRWELQQCAAQPCFFFSGRCKGSSPSMQITNRSRTRAWKTTMGVKAFGVLLAILAAAILVITDQTFWSLQMQGIIPARWWILISAAVGSLPYETL